MTPPVRDGRDVEPVNLEQTRRLVRELLQQAAEPSARDAIAAAKPKDGHTVLTPEPNLDVRENESPRSSPARTQTPASHNGASNTATDAAERPQAAADRSRPGAREVSRGTGRVARAAAEIEARGASTGRNERGTAAGERNAPAGARDDRATERTPAASDRGAPASERASAASERSMPSAFAALQSTSEREGARRAPATFTPSQPKPDSPEPPMTASSKAPLPGGQVTVDFSGEDGLEGKLRVAMRGQTIHATIVSSDRETVERLEGRLPELRRALSERGFDEAQLVVMRTRPLQGAETLMQRGDQRNDSRSHEEARDERHGRYEDGRRNSTGSDSQRGSRRGSRER